MKLMSSLASFAFLTVLATGAAFAGPAKVISLSEKEALIDIDRVEKIVSASDDKQGNTRIVVLTLPGSTDVSPSIQILVTYYHRDEQQNVHTAFNLGDFYGLKKIECGKNGICKIKVVDYITEGADAGMKPVTLTVDTRQIKIDEKNLKLEEFADRHFKSSILVTRKIGK